MTAACERDNFMSAEEAKEFGLIDKVIYHRGKNGKDEVMP